jgi:hypothetical protein
MCPHACTLWLPWATHHTPHPFLLSSSLPHVLPSSLIPPFFSQDADKEIIKALKEAGRVVDQGAIVHSYPFCWRSDTPLIYKAVPSWFVKVEEIKPQVRSGCACCARCA